MRNLFLTLMGRYYQVTGHCPGFIDDMRIQDCGCLNDDNDWARSIEYGMWDIRYGFYTPCEGAWLPRQLAKLNFGAKR